MMINQEKGKKVVRKYRENYLVVWREDRCISTETNRSIKNKILKITVSFKPLGFSGSGSIPSTKV